MSDKVVYRSNLLFHKDDLFYINRCEERSKHNVVFHSHDFVEICYVSSGSGFHLVGNKEYHVYKGDLFIINYDMYHAFYKQNPAESLVTYNIMFKPDFLDYRLINLNDFNDVTLSYLFRDVWISDNAVNEDLRLGPAEQREFDDLFESIYNEYSIKKQGYMSIIRSYLVTLIIKIMRCFGEKSVNDNVINNKTRTVNSIIQYLSMNRTDSLRLDELAVRTFYSKNYLCRLFKEITGTTLSEFLQKLRIEEACKMLGGDRKITQIASEVGFSDYKSFYKVFRKIKGEPPSLYKRHINTL